MLGMSLRLQFQLLTPHGLAGLLPLLRCIPAALREDGGAGKCARQLGIMRKIDLRPPRQECLPSLRRRAHEGGEE